MNFQKKVPKHIYRTSIINQYSTDVYLTGLALLIFKLLPDLQSESPQEDSDEADLDILLG